VPDSNRHHLRNLSTALMALSMAGVITSALWLNLHKERQALQDILDVQARTVLAALDGALRSHSRMGMRFDQIAQSTVEEMAKSPGILGLGIYNDKGKVLNSGGRAAASVALEPSSQWIGPDFLLVREMQNASRKIETTMHRGGMGMGKGAMMVSRPTYQGRLYAAVILDSANYHQALAREWWRFSLSLVGMLAVLGLGTGLIILFQRQGRLVAELSLAAERQERLTQLTQLGAGLAHEIRNPLSFIRGISQQWLSRRDLDETIRRQARQIVDETDRIGGRINSFLSFSRMPAPVLKHVEMAELLGEMAQLFRDEVNAKGIAIETLVAPVLVMADRDMIRQVMVNLLANSLAFCKAGDRITISLKGSDSLSIIVRDTGAGIAPEDLPQVTSPYFSRRSGGTGLGLAIVKQMVEAHGWQLEIDSTPGHGTTVRIRGLVAEEMPAHV